MAIAIRFFIAFIAIPPAHKPVSWPVSYTHLDVYKRQALQDQAGEMLPAQQRRGSAAKIKGCKRPPLRLPEMTHRPFKRVRITGA